MNDEQNLQKTEQQPHLLSQLALGGGAVGVGEMVNIMAHNPNALGVSVVLGLVAAVYSEQTIKVGRTVYGQTRDLVERYQQRKADAAQGSAILPKPKQDSSEHIAAKVLSVIQKQQGPQRLTIDEIVAMCEYNSFKIYIGSSLTEPGAPAIKVSIFKQHFKFIGASQKGKSSMAAAFLDIITQTHDTSRVLIALLDFEDMTSKLFAHLPHLAVVNIDGKRIPLHATTREQVLEYLGYIVDLVNLRYGMTKLEIKDEPILIVYLEEFLALKDYFKSQVKSAGEAGKKQAEKDYADLVFRIKEIARLGLKARVQLVLCAQVDYADEDFREALANVTNGMSFCVKPSAAQAAGFLNADLIAKNAQDKKVGQAVAETVSCNDLVLASNYDLEARLIEFEEREMEEERRNPSARAPRAKSNFLTPAGGHRGTSGTLQQTTMWGLPQTPALPAQREPVREPVRSMTIETILALYDAGKITDTQMFEMCNRLPTVRVVDADEPSTDHDQEIVTDEHLADRRQVIDFQSRRAVNGPVLEDIPMRQEPDLPEDVQKGLEAYDNGANTLDKFAIAMGLTPWTARPLYAKVRDIRGVK